MRVYLTAFGGRLQSDPMDWPERSGFRIEILFPLNLSPFQRFTPEEDPFLPRYRKAIFEATGKARVFNEGERPALEYALVDVA
jgi:hypothetical protein